MHFAQAWMLQNIKITSLNRWGGDIFLGVEDDGTILGVPENAAKDLIRNFNNNIDGDVFRVTIPLDDAIPAAGENVPATTQVTSQVTDVPVNVPVNERQMQILQEVKYNPHITAALLSQKLGVTEKTIKRDLQYLRDKKIIEREGADKNGCWKIME